MRSGGEPTVKKIPRVAIVGFPNVGKSTLFNRLTGKRKALVHSLPGMTRDCIEEKVELAGRSFILVDTGGLFGVPDEPLSDLVRERAWREVERADLVLFMFDSKREVTPAEEELLSSVRKTGVPRLLVVNKVDSPEQEAAAASFYRLGEKETLFVSAEHKRNIELLEEAVARALAPGEGAGDKEQEPLRVAIVGRINVGKSSIINRLLGDERLLVSEIPGTTRDSTDSLVVRYGRRYCLVDTAGIRKMADTRDSREKAGILRAKQNIRRADVICLVLDAREFPTRQDAHIAQLAHDSGKPLMIALNKWDLVDKKAVDPEAVRRIIFGKLGFVDYAPLLLISARTGQRVARVLDLAGEIYENASRRVETSRLNAFLEAVSAAHPPRLVDGGRAKLRYMTQKGVRPPAFILFLGGRGRLLPAYEKYFLEALREKFGFHGTPLRLFVRASPGRG
jgi:GTP-binding protein